MEGRRGKSFWSSTTRVKQEETFFLQNGSMLLEKMLSFCNGKSTPIRYFSAKELILATNNFDADLIIKDDGYYKLFKGSLGSHLVSVKKYDYNFERLNSNAISNAIWDIVVASQMSKHKYVLKLIGCCLEFEIPVAVFEYAGSLGLDDYFNFSANHDVNLEFDWERRLRIANQIANVVLYLHTALPLPVIHRNIKPRSAIIDQFGDAKLSDLSLSIPIPDGETKVEDVVVGTWGYVDPEYLRTAFVTAKSDVYSFGTILLILLTGQKAYDIDRGEGDVSIQTYVKKYIVSGSCDEFIDPRLLGDRIRSNVMFRATLELALKCVEENGENRPDMIDVARELRKIEGVQKQITQ